MAVARGKRRVTANEPKVRFTSTGSFLLSMEGYGLGRLERGERGRITPKVMHDRVELNLPLTLSRRVG